MDHTTTAGHGGHMTGMTHDMTGMTHDMTGMTHGPGMPDHGGMGGHGNMSMDDMSMMKMYFHMDYVGELVLFKGWKIQDPGTLALSMIGVFIFAVLYEGLKFGRQWLGEYAASAQTIRFASDMESKDVLSRRSTAFIGTSPFTFWHTIQTLLHMLQTFISYLLMLIFMTYNVYLCIAIILGAGLGYFAFGWRAKVAVEVTDHCH